MPTALLLPRAGDPASSHWLRLCSQGTSPLSFRLPRLFYGPDCRSAFRLVAGALPLASSLAYLLLAATGFELLLLDTKAFSFTGEASSFPCKPGALLFLGSRSLLSTSMGFLERPLLFLPGKGLLPIALSRLLERLTPLACLAFRLESQRAFSDRCESFSACLGDVAVALHLHEGIEGLHCEIVLAGLVTIFVEEPVPVFHLVLL